MDSRKARSNSGVDFEEDDPDYDIPGSDVVWATEVQCTGTESRLDECFFPENFGGFTRSVSFPIPSRDGAVGVLGEICSARDFLGVVCRRFEIAGVLSGVLICRPHLRHMYATLKVSTLLGGCAALSPRFSWGFGCSSLTSHTFRLMTVGVSASSQAATAGLCIH